LAKLYLTPAPEHVSTHFADDYRKLQFGLFVVLPEAHAEHAAEQKNSTKLLGSAAMQLAGFSSKLVTGETCTSTVTFIRRPQPGTEVPVGRVTVSLVFEAANETTTAVLASQAAQSRGQLFPQRPVLSNDANDFDTAGQFVSVLVHFAVNLPLNPVTKEAPTAAVELRCGRFAYKLPRFVSRNERVAPSTRGMEVGSDDGEEHEEGLEELENDRVDVPVTGTTAHQPTNCNPVWNQLLVGKVAKGANSIRLDIVDATASSGADYIGCAWLSMKGMRPQQHYNMKLVMSEHGREVGDSKQAHVALICSVVVHSSRPHDERVFSTGAAGQRLEVLLQGVDRAHKFVLPSHRGADEGGGGEEGVEGVRSVMPKARRLTNAEEAQTSVVRINAVHLLHSPPTLPSYTPLLHSPPTLPSYTPLLHSPPTLTHRLSIRYSSHS
jgi:hypothetical protein